jgi:cysteinyl-tRNA synthetase
VLSVSDSPKYDVAPVPPADPPALELGIFPLKSSVDIKTLQEKCYAAMDDDFNSPILIANLFDGVKMINSIHDGKAQINEADLALLKEVFQTFAFDILGLQITSDDAQSGSDMSAELIDLLLTMRHEAKQNKDWDLADKIRNQLTEIGVVIKDTKDGFTWEIK